MALCKHSSITTKLFQQGVPEKQHQYLRTDKIFLHSLDSRICSHYLRTIETLSCGLWSFSLFSLFRINVVPRNLSISLLSFQEKKPYSCEEMCSVESPTEKKAQDRNGNATRVLFPIFPSSDLAIKRPFTLSPYPRGTLAQEKKQQH